MSVFIRRFTFDPGTDVLLNIESVNILDLSPPAPVKGVGTGATLIIGEFENGVFGQVIETTSATDLANNWGTLGYAYGGTVANNPSARARMADGALVPEYWNGNAFIQLQGKQYARLFLLRVDTSVGAVQFTRLAYVEGAASFRYLLASGQVLQLDTDAGPQSATFTGAAGTLTSTAGTYPSGFTGGETLTLGYDGNQFTVTFLSSDQSKAQVLARINQYAGFSIAASVTSTTFSLTGLIQGLGGSVQVVGGSSGVLAALGLSVTTVAGTGNVQNIAAVQPTEIATIVQAAVSNSKVEVNSAGALRVSNTVGPYIAVSSGTTATNLGFTVGEVVSNNGQAILLSGAGSYPSGFAGGETLTLQIGKNNAPVTTTFLVGDQSRNQVIAEINAAFTAAGQGSPFIGTSGNRFYAASTGTGPSDIISVISASAGSVLTALGLTVGSVFGSATALGSIPAGTVVQVPTGAQFVTMQDIDFTAGGVTVGAPSVAQGGTLAPVNGPYVVKIRFAQDDGSGVGVGAGTITQVTNAPTLGAFSVINPQIVTNALTETAIDAAYVTAMQASLNINTIAKQTNLMFSARQSNQVRKNLGVVASSASANGLYGRMAMIRPPLNTPAAVAESTVAEPGVGAYRSDRVVYCYIGSNVFVPLIGQVGLAGGAGFTADGNVDVGSDSLMASFCSQLPPEENPGQLTPFAGAINGIETGVNVQNFQMQDYENFKAAGIAALRIDDGAAIFQSGVTSVDPLVFSNLTTIARRRMADYIQDSLAIAAKAFGKQLSTVARRAALLSEIRMFMDGLLGTSGGSTQRIAAYSLNDKQNTPQLIGQGLYRVTLYVTTLSSLDSIVLATTIGPTVVVQEVPSAA
jgi:hypothetical protein